MSDSNSNKILVILGPTASGKTKLAAQLCSLLDGEIISADSRQVYRDMNIGTGKDYEDYQFNGATLPYHLIDICDAGTKYNLHRFTLDFKTAFEQIQDRQKLPVLCGGTGLYLQAALSNLAYTSIPVDRELRVSLSHAGLAELKSVFLSLDKTAFSNLADLSTAKRCIRAIEISRFLLANKDFKRDEAIALSPLIIGLSPSLAVRRQRIVDRLQLRRTNGLVKEVEYLLAKGVEPAMFEYYGLEYKFIWRYLQGEMSENALFELLEIAIQQFAKRQMTYFRKMEKDGMQINWLDADEPLAAQVESCLSLFTEKEF